MSLLNLKNKLFCNKNIGLSNFSLVKTFSKLMEKIKLPDLSIAYTAIKDKIINVIRDTAQATEDEITGLVLNAKSVLEAERKALEDQFDNITEQLKAIKEQAITFITCPEAENNDPKNPETDPVADTQSTPSTNDDEIIVISADTKIKKQTENAKTEGVSAVAEIVTQVNNGLAEQGVLETRTYVKNYSNLHPAIENYTSQLLLFRPCSQVIGDSFFGYTLDKPALQLSEWSKGIAKPIRTSTKLKMRREVLDEIETNYSGLNKGFASNLSNEFFTERRNAPFNTPHAYHIAGDSLFYINHLGLNSTLMTALTLTIGNILGDQIKLVNYLTPVNEQLKVGNELYITTIESNDAIINKRNDIVRKAFTVVDNTVLEPKELAEA